MSIYLKQYEKNDLGFVTTFSNHEYRLENYIGECLINIKKLINPVKISLRIKPKKEHFWMFYYGDRENIPQRLKEMFGYE